MADLKLVTNNNITKQIKNFTGFTHTHTCILHLKKAVNRSKPIQSSMNVRKPLLAAFFVFELVHVLSGVSLELAGI